jgi:hypothetical protein
MKSMSFNKSSLYAIRNNSIVLLNHHINDRLKFIKLPSTEEILKYYRIYNEVVALISM